MSGFGAKLREARENLGITLEAVEAETKIRKLYISAMEEENFAILPPQVYALGFVKRYAEFLQLDANVLSNEFKQIAHPTELEENVQLPLEKTHKGLNLSRLPLKNIAYAAVFLLLVIWVGNYVVGYLSNSLNHPDQTNPTKVENTANNSSTSTPQTMPNKDQLKLQLKIKAGQSCWILVRVDGENKLEATLGNGKQQTFTAKDSIYIRLGNAGAVDLYLNDKKIQSLGGLGQVAEKEFKNSGK